jgi:hypothetical protein
MLIKLIILTLISYITVALGDSSQEFKYKGKMIHPLCIDHFTTMEGIRNRRIDKNLKALGVFHIPKEKIKGIELSKCNDEKKIFTSEENGTQKYSPDSNSREMYEYEVLLKISSNEFLLKTLWNGGGTGYFSNLMVFKTENEKLFLISESKGLGGDRCNGGIDIVNLKNNSFTFCVNYLLINNLRNA